MTEFLQQMLNGVSLGSTYALLALGLAMVFTIFGLVNFAHGELITLSAYAMLGAHYLGWPWVAQVAVALVAGIAAAVAMELRRCVSRARGRGFLGDGSSWLKEREHQGDRAWIAR